MRGCQRVDSGLIGLAEMADGGNDSFVCSNACITAVSFPQTVDELLHLVGGHEPGEGYGYTDMERLLDPVARDGWEAGWSAPKWVTTGDVLFFYHAKKAARRI